MLNAPDPPVDRFVTGLERGSNGETTGGRWLTYAQAGDLLGVSTEAARQLAKRRKWPRQTPNERNAPALILVPLDTAVRPRSPVAAPVERPQTGNDAEVTKHDRADDRPLVALLERAVDVLREQLATANTRVDVAETDRRVAQARTEHAQAEREAERARADAAEADRRAAIALADQSVALLTDAAARADRAEAAVAGERNRADALRDRLDAMQAEREAAQTAAELARRHAQEAQDAAEALRQAEAARKARGRLRRAWAAWRGE